MMVVFFIFGTLLASAAGFDTLGLSQAVVDNNFQFVTNKPLPVQEKVANTVHDQECPQNELLLKILNILTSSPSLNLDGNTKTYVLNLLTQLQNTYNEKNDVDNLGDNPSHKALRGDADNKKIKITLQYELPASNNCEQSLENLHKIINILHESKTAEMVNFEMRTENPEHYKLPYFDQVPQNKLSEDIKPLFDNPTTNIMDLLENYRPKDSAPVQNDNVDVLGKYNAPQNSSPSLIPINYEYNGPQNNQPNYEVLFRQFVDSNKQLGPNSGKNLDPNNENVLWKNSDVNPLQLPLNFEHNYGKPNDALPNDLLKNLISVVQQQTQSQSNGEGNVKSPFVPKVVQDPYGSQNNYDQVVLPVSGNQYPSNLQNGDLPNLNPAQMQNINAVNYVDVRQITNHDNIVEITYVLQQPKSVQYEPVYLVKYRLPLTVFEEAVHKLVLAKPYLKQDPNKLYQELLATLKVDSRFSRVTELRSDEINHANNNETLQANNVLRSKVKEIEDELKIVKDLNANVSSSDLLVISNGTVENELKRLKRHPEEKN